MQFTVIVNLHRPFQRAPALPLSKLLTALPVKCLVHLPRHGLDVQGNLQELRNTLCRFLGLP